MGGRDERFFRHSRGGATVAFVAQALAFELPFVAQLGPFAETAGTLIWFSWTVPMVAYDWLRAIRART